MVSSEKRLSNGKTSALRADLTSRNCQTQLAAKSDNKRQVKQRRNCMVQDFCKTTNQPRSNYKMMTSHVTCVGEEVNSEALSEREVAKIF